MYASSEGSDESDSSEQSLLIDAISPESHALAHNIILTFKTMLSTSKDLFTCNPYIICILYQGGRCNVCSVSFIYLFEWQDIMLYITCM